MQENFNYDAAQGVQKWLQLKLEGKRLKQQLADNAKEMKILEDQYSSEIAALKGVLRPKKVKPAQAPQPTSTVSPTASTMDLDETAPQTASTTTSNETRRDSPNKRPLETILKDSEKKRKAKKGRTDDVVTSAGVFHPTSHTSPLPSVVEAAILNKKD